METYTHAWYESPLDLPETRQGKMAITHRILRPGSRTPVVGMRQALLRGIKPLDAKVTEPLRIHQLVEEDGSGVWMTDLPEELNQIHEMLHTVQPAGRVLVGGLGLGLVATFVSDLLDVSEVVVVEKSADVIRLCGNDEKFETVHEDIHQFLKRSRKRFDFYLLDTWAGTNEGTWWDEVMPLRRTIRNTWGLSPTVHCWAEDIMWGQLFRSLTNALPHWYMKYLPVPMSEDEAMVFLNTVGTKRWEKAYGKGIDRYLHEKVP